MLYIVNSDQVRQNLIREILDLDVKREMKVEISENIRTKPQNALYWKWLTVIGNYLGYTKDEIHEEFASRFLGEVQRTTISGRLLIEPVSTTSLTKKEFSEYMEMIEVFAMSENIKLPHPEYYGMS